MLSNTTLVLGAGGPWGVAWMTGLILGLEDAGIEVRRSRSMIGSSAGAIVGSRLSSDMTIRALFEQETSNVSDLTAHRMTRNNRAGLFE